MINEEKSVIHIKLMKLLGLYQLLNQKYSTIIGYNLLKCFTYLEIQLIVIFVTMSVWSVLWCYTDLFAIVRFSMSFVGGLVAGVKLYTMIRTSNKIRKCLQYTSIDYLIYKDHDKDLLMEVLSSETEELTVFNNFKTLIEDQLRTFRFIREIYTIFQQNTILQIALNSSLFLTLLFQFIVNISKGQPIVSFQNVLFIFTAFSNLFEMLIACYFFQIINDEKEKINFALYSCNWTEMGIEFQKLILIGMRVNDAEKTKMKITTQKLIDVHLFGEIIQRSYSILSVFANCVFR
ncbi:uncharacterized protein LOC126902974 isoform X4 [Daktulosphaira vitifoliae]|uniref:uncharacterized protein LOC126902974 isoform X4 n=1 Tax=Daktulosphaira vitifoliae TaxID=58002 RepID=UPI0021A9CC0B|nr:uncharacterized protein LOC126902974 isoform X4 [Daktulosphaira vitifoliae]